MRILKYYMNGKRQSELTRKILLILMAGVALGFTRSPRRYFRILRDFRREWKELGASPAEVSRKVQSLRRRNLLYYEKSGGGDWVAKLTHEGVEQARRCRLEDLKIARPARWDGKWRMVMFDIPEDRKRGRDALARVLKNLDFYQFQKSVFIHPFECRSEVKFVAEFFQVTPFVKFAVVSEMEGDNPLRKHFEI